MLDHPRSRTISRTQLRLVEFVDLMPIVSLERLSEVLTVRADEKLKNAICSSPRLSGMVADLLCSDACMPRETYISDARANDLLLHGTREELESAIALATAYLASARIRQAIDAGEVTRLRATFGEDIYAAALDCEGPALSADIPFGPDLGWIALGQWIGQFGSPVSEYLSIRFTRDEKDLMAAGPSCLRNQTLIDGFEWACARRLQS